MDAVIVRAAVPDDAPGIALVHVRSWQGAYRGLLPAEFLDSLDPAQRTDVWRASLARPGSSCALVVADGPQIIGFAHVGPTRDEDGRSLPVGEITSLYLLPEVWGRGIGKRLMAEALRVLREGGYSAATLWVLSGNARAIRFYESAGWEADGAIKHAEIAGGTYPEVRYRRSLA